MNRNVGTARERYADRIIPGMRMPHEYTEVSYPACVGWRWEGIGDGGRATVNELVWTRDANAMVWSLKGVDGRWVHHPSQHPKMRGVTKLSDARDVAEWFINGHMLPEHDDAYIA